VTTDIRKLRRVVVDQRGDHPLQSISVDINSIADDVQFNLSSIADATDTVIDTVAEINALPYGQCRFDYTDASTCTLSRYNGASLTIDGTRYEIPTSGPTLGITGLTNDTLYYVYALYENGAIALRESTTAPTAAATGLKVKSDNSAWTYVGMVYPKAGAFVNTYGSRLVASWFNRRPSTGWSQFTAARSTTSITLTEVNTEIRVNFLTHVEDPVDLRINGAVYNAGTDYSYTVASIDGDAGGGWAPTGATGTNGTSIGISQVRGAGEVTTGFHYATLKGATSNAASAASWEFFSFILTTLTVLVYQ
jgi:hypothetical protein